LGNIKWVLSPHLFTEPDVRCYKSVALAVDGWASTPSNGVHFPMGVVIVDHMEISMSTSENVKKYY
jgi:hypothetical protein